MNKIFKVIWNPATGSYSVASETAKSRGKKSGRSKLLISALVAGGLLSSFGAFTEFNPAQTQYFILNNGSVGLAGRVLAIDAVENGSVIRISLVNLLSVPVSNIGFHATWGNERPTDAKALAKWQQLLFNTTMNSTLQLMPGQWQDINLTLKGVSPNNLKYLKLSINMANLQFDTVQSAETRQRKNKK